MRKSVLYLLLFVSFICSSFTLSINSAEALIVGYERSFAGELDGLGTIYRVTIVTEDWDGNVQTLTTREYIYIDATEGKDTSWIISQESESWIHCEQDDVQNECAVA